MVDDQSAAGASTLRFRSVVAGLGLCRTVVQAGGMARVRGFTGAEVGQVSVSGQFEQTYGRASARTSALWLAPVITALLEVERSGVWLSSIRRCSLSPRSLPVRPRRPRSHDLRRAGHRAGRWSDRGPADCGDLGRGRGNEAPSVFPFHKNDKASSSSVDDSPAHAITSASFAASSRSFGVCSAALAYRQRMPTTRRRRS